MVGSGPSLIYNTAAITADRTWTIQDVAGTILPAAAAGTFTNNHALKAVRRRRHCYDCRRRRSRNRRCDFGRPEHDEQHHAGRVGGERNKDHQKRTGGIVRPTTDNASGNGQYYFRVPVSLNGTNLIGIQSNAVTAGTTGPCFGTDYAVRGGSDIAALLRHHG